MVSETKRVPLWPLYVGSLLGPLGGALLNAILPEVAQGVSSDEAGVSAAITAYMIPFASLMLVSGTLAMRWGLGRTLKWTYAVFALSSLACATATSLVPLMAARAVQGAANAFVTPIVVVLISQAVPPNKLGRAMGMFASMQAAGHAFAPMIAGFAAEYSYRWAFVAVVVVSGVLLVSTSAGDTKSEAKASNWGALRNVRLARSAGIAFCAQYGSSVVMILGALVAADRFGLGASERGLVVASFGIAGLIFSGCLGVLSERKGYVRVGVIVMVLLSLATGLVGIVPWQAGLVAAIALAGAAGSGSRVLTNTLALSSTPSNTSGATSVTLSAQFFGLALVPALIPLYRVDAGLAFGVAAVVVLAGAGLAATARLPKV